MKFARPVKAPTSNSVIGIFSPSEPVTSDRVARIEPRLTELKAAGRRVVFGENWLKHEAFQAGSADERLSDVHDLLARYDVELLLASWGGKSCAHLLRSFDYELAGRKEKPIAAFSDGCTLLNAITTRSGIVTFYGPNVLGKLHESQYGDLRQFYSHNGFSEMDLSGSIEAVYTTDKASATGVLVGGNLSSFVVSILGSEYEPNFDDVILFLESGTKKPQEFDFLLSALLNSRFISNVRGVLFGSIPEKEDHRWGNSVGNLDIVERVFGSMGIPVIVTKHFGHEELPNPALPIGALATIDPRVGMLSIESECLR